MKHIFLLAVALVMTCTFAFAQSQTPYAKGKYYGKQLITLAIQDNQAALDKLSENAESYILNNLETEDDFIQFIEGLEAGMREGCKAQGLSDYETEQVVALAGEALLEGMIEALY
jgi:predicted NACHT family NTPase